MYMNDEADNVKNQGVVCREGDGGMSCRWISSWALMAYFVLMCYGHSILIPSLTGPTNRLFCYQRLWN